MGRGMSEEKFNFQCAQANNLKSISLPRENQLISFEQRNRLKGSVGNKVKECTIIKEYNDYFLVMYDNNRKDTLHKKDFLTGVIIYKTIELSI